MRRILLLWMLMALAMAHANAQTPPGEVAWRQRPGHQVPEVRLHDESGAPRAFSTFMDGLPAILALGYYHCPGLCGLLRNDLLHALDGAGLVAGRDYALIVVSIDPAETPGDAAAAKTVDSAAYPLPGAPNGWHYLTADAASIAAIADAVGFRDQFRADAKQFLHPTGIVFLTPQGHVSGYRLGLGYEPAELQQGLAKARLGQLARAALPVVLLCFHFDPVAGRYTLSLMRALQVAGVLTVLTTGGAIALALFHERGRT
jgi:protein SCO1/2